MRQRTVRRSHQVAGFAAFLAALLALVLLAPMYPVVAQGGTEIVVTTLDDTLSDDSQCSLREAIIAANTDNPSGNETGECPAGDGADTILLPGGTLESPSIYALTLSDSEDDNLSGVGDLDIDDSVTIRPSTANGVVVVDADAIDSRVFDVRDGTVTIERVTIRGGSDVSRGGGIRNYTTLNLENVTLTDNEAFIGGAIANQGDLSLTNVTIQGNSASGGAAIRNGNLLDNSDGDAVTSLHNTLIGANDTAIGPDCLGPLTRATPDSANLVPSASDCSLSGALTGNPQTEAINDSGGLVVLFALAETSPARNTGTNAGCPATDQRGLTRPQETQCDIGAYEREAPNAPPVANAQSVETDEDEALLITLTATDSDNATLSFSIETVPQFGTLGALTPLGDGKSATVLYTPDENYHGDDEFSFTVEDDEASSTADVDITVISVNDVPTTTGEEYTVAEDGTLTVAAAQGVLANDSDLESELLAAHVTTPPAHGTLTLNPNGSFIYTPTANYHGADSFAYVARDGSNADSAATTVDLEVTSVNDAPSATGEEYTVAEDGTLIVAVAQGVLVNDNDIDGDALTAHVTTPPAHGTLNLNPNGSFTYTPTANYHGADSFQYTARDPSLTNSAATTVDFDVTSVNDAPSATGEEYTVAEDGTLTVAVAQGVLVNDDDIDGDALTAHVTTPPAHGTLNLNPNGSFIYTPTANYHGADSFEYVARDGSNADSAATTVDLDVTSVNDAPSATGEEYTVAEDGTLTVAVAQGVLANDDDIDGDALTAHVTTPPTHGTLNLNADGSFTYSPTTNFHGEDFFQYTARDPSLTNSAATTVDLDVTLGNDAPTATGESYSVAEDGVLTVAAAQGVLANDGDIDGDALTAHVVTPPANGTLTLNLNGSFTYTPSKHYDGADSFQYVARDPGSANSSAATVNITVTPDEFLEVTNTSDSGRGSLRYALRIANEQAGVDSIIFDIPGAGPHTISPQSALPTIIEAVIVDGSSQQPIVNGSQAGAGIDGLTVQAEGTQIQGLTIAGFGGSGIVLAVGGNTVQNNTIRDNGSHGITVLTCTTGNTIVSNAITGNGGSGIHISGCNGNTIHDNTISDNDGDGVTITNSSNNSLQGNTITGNGGNGITIVNGNQNGVLGNNINGNGGQAIDLGGDGETPNDPGDGDSGPNDVQNHPVIYRATPIGSDLFIEGWLNSFANGEFRLQFFGGETCSDSAQTLIGDTEDPVVTDADGNAYFQLTLPVEMALGDVIRATATDSDNNTSEFSPCIVVSIDNDSWPRSLLLTPGVSAESIASTVEIEQYLDQPGQARWYRFPIAPESIVTVLLTNLPANYDVTLYKDIAQAFDDLNAPQALTRLSAEFAPSSFAPSSFAPSSFAPSSFAPSSFAPSSFAPSSFAPSLFTDFAFSPSVFTPEAFSPGVTGASSQGTLSYAPSSFAPSSFAPSSFAPSSFAPSSFASAQTRSLIGVSAADDMASESITLNTWNNTGYFYVRVRGRDGVFDLHDSFHLSVTVEAGPCQAMLGLPALPATSLNATVPGPGGAASYEAIILTDLARMKVDPNNPADAAKLAALPALLAELAQSVNGVVVDVGADARVAAANERADQNYPCPYAKNVVAESIKSVVDAYSALNPELAYVVIVGNDDVIPLFRYADGALIGHESDYVPPVFDDTASQASLRLGYVLSQDAYGAPFSVSVNASELPIPGLAVGRMVETASDISVVINAYLATGDGVAIRPDSTISSLVTGYDFMVDVADEIAAELAVSTNAPPNTIDTLITPADKSPFDPESWTADDLRGLLLTKRYDLAFLAGHFSANSALAADYTTHLLASELAGSTVDLTNAIFYSNGCHSGYNIVNQHGVPNVTLEPDWAQAFARKGATLIAGTGYQYGDTEFIEYSERLYLEFTRQLRTGDGPVSIGQALVEAKRRYLVTTPVLKGIHEKAYLEATLFGLPMLKVDLPGERLAAGGEGFATAQAGQQAESVIVAEDSIVGSVEQYDTDPGLTLGLAYADISLTPTLAAQTKELQNADDPDGAPIVAQWLEGRDGIVVNPAEPALPLEVEDVSVDGRTLRGVGFRSGSYTNVPGIVPLTGAPATELRGVHTPFNSSILFPIRTWNVNYFDALADADEGATYLNLMPAQHQSTEPGSRTSTRRQFSAMSFRLFYSSNTESFGESVPALSAEPTIVSVVGVIDGESVDFRVTVVGNPAAGIQAVWVTYTSVNDPLNGEWQSLDLTQSNQDSTLWQATLDLPDGTEANQLRFIAQAVNGVGLVAMADNVGHFYIPGDVADPEPTTLTFDPVAETTGAFGAQATFSAVLKDNGAAPLSGRLVTFGLGSQSVVAITNNDGRATATIPLLGVPGEYAVTASFPGTEVYAPSSADYAVAFAIELQTTNLTLEATQTEATGAGLSTIFATLRDATGKRLVEHTVVFVVNVNGTEYTRAAITNLIGQASFDNLLVPPGAHLVTVNFPGTTTYAPSTISDSLDFSQRTTDVGVLLTVGTDPNGCSAASLLITPPGVDAYYCLIVENTGEVLLDWHEVEEPAIGLEAAFNLTLGAGVTTTVTRTLVAGLGPVAVTSDITNTLTYTAANTEALGVGELARAAATAEAFVMIDSEGDTIPDRVEGTGDADLDNTPNYLDTDSDDDGILDRDEVGPDPLRPRDTNGDGVPDYLQPRPTDIEPGKQPNGPSLFLPFVGVTQ